ncbi:hypothetical protein [Streptomyces canus]|uniref:hypothetical protein n=1 Tax=Streptomyces canus TaxID=58343 RepID=UPI00371638A9
MQPTPVSALWLMAAGRDCLRTSHVHRLMVEAALLRTMSETDSPVQAAWASEEDHEARDPAARPQIPAVRSADGEVRAVRTPAATGATVGGARTGVPQSSPG